MKKAKVRSHNEHFRQVSLGNRKSCPTCRCKLAENESVWSWGEYVRAKWHTVKHFCRECFEEEVRVPLLGHAGDCGCNIVLCGYHGKLPEWLTLTKNEEVCKV